MSIDLNKPYNPGMAELGKFAEVVAPSVSSYGHYAILTIDAGSLPVSAGGTGGPAGTFDDPIWTNMTTVISAVEVSLSGVQMDENIKSIVPIAISSIDIPQSQALPTYIVGTNSVSVSVVDCSNDYTTVLFPQTATFVEIYNNDPSNKVYVSWETTITELSALTARGLPISNQTYYSIEKTATQVVIGAVSAIDIRIFGHSR